jgi:transcriptional repressor NrdR
LDVVGYMRFASVYRGFSTIEDFEREVAGLKALHRVASAAPPDAGDSQPTRAQDTRTPVQPPV